jgi:hypothetical protein
MEKYFLPVRKSESHERKFHPANKYMNNILVLKFMMLSRAGVFSLTQHMVQNMLEAHKIQAQEQDMKQRDYRQKIRLPYDLYE